MVRFRNGGFSILENHTCINATDLQQFLEAVGSEHEFAQGTLLNKSVSTRWDFAGAFSFVVTVVTTIGKSGPSCSKFR